MFLVHLGSPHGGGAGIGFQGFVNAFFLSQSKFFCHFTRLVNGDFLDGEDSDAGSFICGALVLLPALDVL